jgi:predicted DNA-binding protein
MKNQLLIKENVYLSIDIPIEINERLKEIADDEGRSVKSLLRRVIKKYVNDYKKEEDL